MQRSDGAEGWSGDTEQQPPRRAGRGEEGMGRAGAREQSPPLPGFTSL